MINKNILFSDKNKSIIWNVLYNNNVFYNIDNNNKNDIISIIDNSIKSFHKNLIKNEIDIIQVNKLNLKDIIDKVSKLKKNSIINDVEIAKDDLNSVLSIKKPEEINFKDDSNDEIIDNENLSDILNKMMEQRNRIKANKMKSPSHGGTNTMGMSSSGGGYSTLGQSGAMPSPGSTLGGGSTWGPQTDEPGAMRTFGAGSTQFPKIALII